MEDISAENQRELVRLWRVFQTTRQMLQDRGYKVPDEECTITLEDFRVKYADADGKPNRVGMSASYSPSDAMIARYTDPPTASRPTPPEPLIGNVYISFDGSSSIGIKQLRTFVQTIDRENFFTGILVTAAAVTQAALKIGNTIHPKILEVFHESDLLVNITKHELVPKHVLLSKEEKMKLLERYRLKETQLPRIQYADPVARYLGLRKGQVVKIIRQSATAGRYASYRWCI